MAKRILMIAFHYPPILVSSGVHRTAKFVEYLPDFGWLPDVLTVHTRAYIKTSTDLPLAAPNTSLTRAFAVDTARHLAIAGRYSKFMSLPDRWISWWIGAVPAGLRLIKKNRPDVIWSTYPIATTHLIAYTLHRITGIPWVVDMRDPMTDTHYPRDKHVKAAYRWIENKTINNCSHAVFTTPDTLTLYARRFPNISRERWHVIANGYDEDAFAKVEKTLATKSASGTSNPLKFVHSGILYRIERNPEPFFIAIAELKKNAKISKQSLNIILRASGDEDYYQQRLKTLNIEDIIFFESSLPYQEALTEMLVADGLLLFQAANCNHQIPAKAYEYLRAKRPIFAMTDHNGNTAHLLKEAGINSIVNIESSEEIAAGLLNFIQQVENNTASLATDSVIQSHSRKQRTVELAKILDSIKP